MKFASAHGSLVSKANILWAGSETAIACGYNKKGRGGRRRELQGVPMPLIIAIDPIVYTLFHPKR